MEKKKKEEKVLNVEKKMKGKIEELKELKKTNKKEEKRQREEEEKSRKEEEKKRRLNEILQKREEKREQEREERRLEEEAGRKRLIEILEKKKEIEIERIRKEEKRINEKEASKRKNDDEYRNFERDITLAVNLFWDNSGLFKKDYLDGDYSTIKEDYSKLSAEIINECIGDYNSKMNTKKIPLLSCSSCGVRDFDIGIEYYSLDKLQILKLNDEEVKEFLEREFKELYNIYFEVNSQAYYHLHSKFIKEDEIFPICKCCYTSIIEGKIPEYSLKAGFDYGNYKQINLDPPSKTLRKVLSMTRMYSTLYKLVAPGGLMNDKTKQTALKEGHIFTRKHHSPVLCKDILSNIRSLSENIEVAFVGTKDEWNILKEKLTNSTFLTISAKELINWFRVLTSSNEYFKLNNIEMPEFETSLEEELRVIKQKILNNTHVFDDPLTKELEEHIKNDVARVRQVIENIIENEIPDAIDYNNLNEVLLSSTTAPTSESILQSTIKDLNTLTNQKLYITRENELQNEFTENDDIMLGTFPHLFILGNLILSFLQFFFLISLLPSFSFSLLFLQRPLF
jgi:hypothetical protein